MLTSDESLIFARQGRTFAAAEAVATGRIEAAVIRALVTVAEWSDSSGRIVVGSSEHAEFARQIADSIRGAES